MTYQPHRLAEQFPEIGGSEFDKLVASIKADGLKEPITIHEGAILDGRNRSRRSASGSGTADCGFYR